MDIGQVATYLSAICTVLRNYYLPIRNTDSVMRDGGQKPLDKKESLSVRLTIVGIIGILFMLLQPALEAISHKIVSGILISCILLILYETFRKYKKLDHNHRLFSVLSFGLILNIIIFMIVDVLLQRRPNSLVFLQRKIASIFALDVLQSRLLTLVLLAFILSLLVGIGISTLVRKRKVTTRTISQFALLYGTSSAIVSAAYVFPYQIINFIMTYF